MSEPMSTERLAAAPRVPVAGSSEPHILVRVAEVRDLLAEVDRLRAAVPSWADLRDVLADLRYTAATDVEMTNAVMALITGADHG